MSGFTSNVEGPSARVRRVLVRDDLLLLAADADQAIGIVREQERLARKYRDESNLSAMALKHHLSEAAAWKPWAIRGQAWSYAGIIIRFCDLVGEPVNSPHPALECHAHAFEALRADGSLDEESPGRDPALGVYNRYHMARELRLCHRYDEALSLVDRPAEIAFFGTGAEPRRGHFLYEQGACLIFQGQAVKVSPTLTGTAAYWSNTRASGFSTRYRFDFILALAAWEQASLPGVDPGLAREAHARAIRGMTVALNRIRSVGRPRDLGSSIDTSGIDLPSRNQERDVSELSVILALAECLMAGELTDETTRQAVELGCQALEAVERVRGRWRVIIRSLAPLAVAVRRVYGDIALLAATISGEEAAELGLRVALSAKQTGFASRIREQRLLMSPLVLGLLDAIVDVEDPSKATLGAADGEYPVIADQDQLRSELEEAVSPMLADTVLPIPARLESLVETIGHRYALDYVELPDTLSGHANWFRTLIQPRGSITFEHFRPGEAYTAFFYDSGPSVDGPAHEKWLGRLRDATDNEGPDWRGLAREVLPENLIYLLEHRCQDRPVDLLISAHSALSLLPWAALMINDTGTRLVERAVIAQCPVLTCLSGGQPAPVAGPALVRLVGRGTAPRLGANTSTAPRPGAENAVNITQELLAWGLDNDLDGVAFSRCDLDPDSSPVGLTGEFVPALTDAAVRWQFIHIAAHGGGKGLAQYLLLPERLLAAHVLNMRWPPSVLMASCHVGQLVNAEDAEPLSFVMALLTGGTRCVVAGIDKIPDTLTGLAASRMVDEIRNVPVRLDIALRSAQLEALRIGAPPHSWALLSAYTR